MLLDEEDERERVLLVGVGTGTRELVSDTASGTVSDTVSDMVSGTVSDVVSDTASDTAPKWHAGNEMRPQKLATFAMSVTGVREVVRGRTATRVPGTPSVMRGLINVRGMVITVLDLATCLGLSAADQSGEANAECAGSVTEPRAQTGGSIVLLEHGNRLVGLAVDIVREVRALDDVSAVGPSDSTQLSHGFVRGLASAGGEVVTLLDVAALISRHLISGES